MTLILSGTDGLSDVDGSAATPAIRGTDANTGIFFGADIIGFAEGGAEVARFNADAQFVAAAGTAALPVITTTGDVNTGIFFPAADTIAFATAGTEDARFDSAGNFGLGVTPSAWGSSDKAIDIGGGNQSSISANFAGAFATNAYFNGTDWKYKNSLGNPGLYSQSFSGNHQWFQAASGTAGNTISFTQAMTLDASGRLGITETSPSYKVDVKVSTAATIVDLLRLNNGGGSNGGGAGLVFEDAGARARVAGVVFGANENSGLGLGFYTSTDTSGSVTERARIDSGGNFLVRCTSAGFVNDDGTSIETGAIVQRHINGTASGTGYTFFIYNGSMIGSIIQSGTSAVTYNTTSDYRLKTVTSAVTGQGARIDALKPIDYQWKESNEQARGFLAHEFQEVYPSSVSGNKDAIDKDGKPAYQSMQAATSEVIADLVAEIQSLRKRLATLEST